MDEMKFTNQQSLEIMREMIHRSKKKYSHHAGTFLIWAWAIITAAAITYFHITMQWTFNLFYIWVAAIVIPGVWTAYKGITERRESEQGAKSPIETYMTALWGGSAGLFTIIMLIGLNYNWILIYPLLIAIYGWGALVSGALIRFRPLVWGGISNFFIAGVAVFVTSEAILLLLIAALTCSYLIPGYMLKNSDK